MKRDLLLTHGYFLRDDPKELQIMKPYAPLGLLYICSHLRAKGFAVDVFDSTFATKEDLFRVLETEEPATIGVYANLMTRPNVVTILERAKALGWRTVVGGPEAGAYPAEYLDCGADVVVKGEGELTLEDLLPVLNGRDAEHEVSSLAKVNGIAYRTADGSVAHTPPREQIKDIDAQPWPARDAIDIHQYVRTWREAHGQGSVNLITARGCPYSCNWCSHQVFGQTHRRRDPLLVVDEIESLLKTYAPDMLWFADDVFTIHHGWLRRFAAEMKRRGLRIPFETISRADRVNEEMADLLAELGCFRLWIGSESGSQRILDAMSRGVKVEQVQSSVRALQQRGIKAGMFLMWGYEGEDMTDIRATIEHVKTSQPDVFFTTVSYPIRGTPYFERVKDRVVQEFDWRDGSDRNFKIAGRHSRKFYEFADKLLRDEVELHRRSAAGGETEELTARVRQWESAMQGTFAEVEA